ncbi:lipase member M-like [Dermacentor andersoni]|uniref:lipase member M-like n=1 Tax=Dermacentor andersoni TaxID=34620 RepID=UPI002155F1A9|nr:lipase member M-like [Dermacentor andersoni]
MAAIRRPASILAAFLVLASTSTCDTAEDELALQARLTSCELIRYFHYPCEISYATTNDGYVLEVNRVPRGRQGNAAAEQEQNGTRRHPVLFVPPLLSGSDVWFLNYPSQAAGFLFADAGFDVWSMNFRDSGRYSNHTTLSKNDPEYWKLSFDEIGRYDAAAGVDHVLNATGAERLTLLALSQGVTSVLVLLSTRPEYNDKVTMREMAGYLGASEGLSVLLAQLCEILSGEACSLAITITLFSSSYQLNEVYKAKDFVMYNHGVKENCERYNQTKPLAYPLHRITTPWAIFSSEGDQVADSRDTEELVARLGSRVILHRVLPQKTFGHVDFAIGYKCTDFLHNVAIDVVKQQIGLSE